MVVAPNLALDASVPAPSSPAERSARLEGLARENFQFIWRSLRRLGVAQDCVDDAVQQVFEVASRRLGEIEVGRERAFLFKTALLVAQAARRGLARSQRLVEDDALDACTDPRPGPEELADRHRHRALLDAILDALPAETRPVFVLFELEELSTLEVARVLEIPVGTVASRLRRAREDFLAHAKRLRARWSFRGDVP
jgi:RNA polymerase sigma-70 factor, ECF subfamily